MVDDEPLVRMLLADQLRADGFVVIEASQAEEALDFFLTGEPVDLVFTDIRMPGGMTGVELAARVKAARAEVRIILTSGDPRPLNLTGLGSFIAKPYPVREAVEMVRGMLGQTPDHD